MAFFWSYIDLVFGIRRAFWRISAVFPSAPSYHVHSYITCIGSSGSTQTSIMESCCRCLHSCDASRGVCVCVCVLGQADLITLVASLAVHVPVCVVGLLVAKVAHEWCTGLPFFVSLFLYISLSLSLSHIHTLIKLRVQVCQWHDQRIIFYVRTAASLSCPVS